MDVMFYQIKLMHLSINMILLFDVCNSLRLSTTNQGNIDAETIPNVYEFYTKLTTFGVSRVTGTFLTFQVKSCRDAAVLLSTSADLISTDFYEIFYGGGGNSQIFLSRNFGTNVAQSNARNLLDCNNMVTLWVSWANGILKTGTGSIKGQNQIMEWNDPNSSLDVAGIGIMSAWGSNAEWIFSSGDIGYDIKFCGSAGKKFTNTGVTMYNLTELKCAFRCIGSDSCVGFDYNDKLQKCHMVTDNGFLQNGHDNDSILYTKCWSI